MARPRLRAKFFVDQKGATIVKAPTIKAKDRFRILERDGYKCQLCGADLVKFRGQTGCPGLPGYKPLGHVDHIFPRSRGGQNHDSNLQSLCEPCNMAKGAA